MKSFFIIVGLIIALIVAYMVVSFLTGILWFLVKLLFAAAIVFVVIQVVRKK